MSAAKPASTCPDCAAQRKLARKYKRALQELTAAVRQDVEALDAVLAQPEGFGRDRKLAQISNALEMANDHARYFGLGVDCRAVHRQPSLLRTARAARGRAMTITLDQLRRELGLTRSEWRELQYAAVDREVSTREFIRTMLVWCSAGRPTPAWLWQSQSTRSPERGSSDGTSSRRKATRCT